MEFTEKDKQYILEGLQQVFCRDTERINTFIRMELKDKSTLNLNLMKEGSYKDAQFYHDKKVINDEEIDSYRQTINKLENEIEEMGEKIKCHKI